MTLYKAEIRFWNEIEKDSEDFEEKEESADA